MQSRIRHSAGLGRMLGSASSFSFSSYWTTRTVTGVSIQVDSDTQFTVSWTNNGTTDYTGHKIYTSLDDVTYSFAKTVASIGTSTTLTGLTAGTLYYVKVAPYKDTNIGTLSSADSDTTFTIDLYANFFGLDHVFANGDTIAEDTYGVDIGTLKVKDTSTGQIELLNKYLYGYGDSDYTDTIVYGGSAFSREFGRVVRISLAQGSLIHKLALGFCKTDLSDCGTSEGVVTFDTTAVINAKIGSTAISVLDKLLNTGYEFLFFIGGFDSASQPYSGSNKANYNYGCLIFMKGIGFPFWTLLSYTKYYNTANLVPFVAFNSNDTSPRGKGAIVKMMSYKINDLNILQKSIAISSNDQFTLDVNDLFMSFMVTLADGEEISLYFCIDDYTTPQNGYRLKISRSTTVTYTLYRIDDGSETTLATSQALTYAATTPRLFRILDGLILKNNLDNYSSLQLTSHLANNKAKIVDGANSHIIDFVSYKLGKSNYYRDKLFYKEPFFTGSPAPGYNLPAEARKGHYFDVSSQSTSWGVELVGAFAYLINGSSQMVVKYRNHTDQQFIDELTFTINLRYAYSGTNAIIYIGSDPHFGYANNNGTINYRDIIIPDLNIVNPTHCFILGDIVHDNATYYASYIAAKSLYPSATWYETTGNHDVIADFKTDLGYANDSYIATIGNCAFIMVGYTVADQSAFINASLDANVTKNCFIMAHRGRKDTTVATDTDYTQDPANIDTGLTTRKFVAWFAGHSHGYIANTRKITQAKYLNLGDNN